METVWTLILCLFVADGVLATRVRRYDYSADDADERYRRETTLYPELGPRSSYTDVNPPEQDNNHKPVLNCEQYKPNVKEEEDRGTHVLDVVAIDDDPKDQGGTVTYNMVQRDGDRVYFTINNKTGQVRTASVFDRDEPSRQKEFYLTVQAMDNGRPPLTDVCSFKVTIVDINDNSPIFDSASYKGHVSEDLKEQSEVMRVFAYDYDDGENSRLTYNFSGDFLSVNVVMEYFYIDSDTGVIYLKKSLAGKKGTVYPVNVTVHDNGQPQRFATAEVAITVVGSDKKAPSFTYYPTEPIYLNESYANYEEPITVLRAESNIKNKGLKFEMLKGKTPQTNKDQTFILEPNDDEAKVVLARPLDYETVTEYQLTVRVTNKDLLASSVNFVIKILDVNDEIPLFIELPSGSVVENDQKGAQAMQVRAIDKDGTAANNIVSYELTNHTDLFQIDSKSGIITALSVFDREQEEVYHLEVKASDNSPSALKKSRSEPNSAVQTFSIIIKDRNDNKPVFTQTIYTVHNISEITDKGKDVIEVKATDRDSASVIKYSIIAGNINNDFYMEEATGRIKVAGKLDYEKVESYNLTVQAFDGIYQDNATVIIEILNENDEQPKFENYSREIELQEEKSYSECIIRLKATDPDIKDINANQRIIYRVLENHKSFLGVNDENGEACVTLKKPLNRDKPNGSPSYQGIIYAFDNDGGPNTLSTYAEINITLIDINDNAPFLTITEVVWDENQRPGDITTLTADDYDSPENGAPFMFQLADTASEEIQMKFDVVFNTTLQAKVTFDREEQKYYDVPIAITDSGTPRMTGISIIRVIIGDVNDNEARPGSSEIFVYNFENGYPIDVQIGRVYVEDPDDWDLPDKYFQWDSYADNNFGLDEQTGMITMKAGTQDGKYVLKFMVTENPKYTGFFERHHVNATVQVTVKGIPEEAVKKSGSIRLAKTSIEEFIEKSEKTFMSKKDLLQHHIASILNTSVENVDVFTVLQAPSNKSYVDVRFSAHGSPYYLPEKLNSKISLSEDELEQSLGVNFIMVGINECLQEEACPSQSCTNTLMIKPEPAVVFTNKTSFVGVQAVVEAICDCVIKERTECLNGGTPMGGGGCICPPDYEGQHCELLAVAFYGDGWSMYPTLDACINSEIILEVSPSQENGLVFYVGPMGTFPPPITRDFMALQLENGFPVLLLDYGSGTTRIELRHKKLTDGASHSIRILYSPKEIQISIDDCHKSDCQQLGDPVGGNMLLNVNGPLQLGGTSQNLQQVGNLLGWEHLPTSKGYFGCIRNFTFNGFTYDLSEQGDYRNTHRNCNYADIAKSVSFGIDSKFLVAILVCIVILIILLLAVVVHRKKQDNWNEKDIDDARETIIDYQVEGGGEFDTQFDMNVLRCEDEEKAPIKEKLYKQGPEVSPDINSFLTTKKDTCDRDPDNLPFDDVRYYAYEGDGNSTGSLSSLASCTDDGDLKFNYLSNFGPRFRKLADMYGEDPSDEDSQDGGEESWC